MKLLRSLKLVLASALLCPTLAWSAPPPEPKVDYSADSVMETEGGTTMTSRIYHSPGKQRMEMGGKDGIVSIIRKDKKVIWQLMGNMYMESPLKLDDNNPESMDIQQTVVGEETVNGIKTTKSKVIATKKDGSKFGGFFWTTKDNITVKMDLLSKEGNRKDRVSMELKNLKVGKVDPKLFEIPPGYEKNDMAAAFGGMGKGKGGKPNLDEMMKGMGKDKDDEGEIDVNKMMKGLMGR